MFIYSVRASTLRFFGIIGGAALLLAVVVMLVPGNGAVAMTSAAAEVRQSYNYEKIKTNEDRVKFLEQFGWTVESEPKEEVELTLPAELDRILQSYNELQKSQGLNLERYRGKKLTRYTYTVTNYPGYDGRVCANVIVYKNRVVGGDVCSADVNGFIGTFIMPK